MAPSVDDMHFGKSGFYADLNDAGAELIYKITKEQPSTRRVFVRPAKPEDLEQEVSNLKDLWVVTMFLGTKLVSRMQMIVNSTDNMFDGKIKEIG